MRVAVSCRTRTGRQRLSGIGAAGRAMLLVIQASSWDFGTAPIFSATTSPPLKMSSVGMPRTLYCCGVSGFSSMFNFTIEMASPCASLSSSRASPMAAGATPFGPEINKHGLVGLQDVGRKIAVGCLYCCHRRMPPVCGISGVNAAAKSRCSTPTRQGGPSPVIASRAALRRSGPMISTAAASLQTIHVSTSRCG